MVDARKLNVQSDMLADLRQHFAPGGPLETLGHILQVALILDANIVLKDIRWLAMKRENQTARTELLEVLHAETVRALAPTFLIEEIARKLPKIAERYGISEEELERHWATYRALIQFVDVGGPAELDAGYRDPKDAPYLELQARLKADILSTDSDITIMGGHAVPFTIVAYLRAYSRAAAVEYSLKVAGAGVITLSQSILTAVCEFLKAAVHHMRRMPPWMWVAAVAIVALALAQPSLRRWLMDQTRNLPERAKQLGIILIRELGPLLEEHARARQVALTALDKITTQMHYTPVKTSSTASSTLAVTS